ncbi:FHA domain-containing protein [bacterium]|nr:FHA domain-containing protein [bacterium]
MYLDVQLRTELIRSYDLGQIQGIIGSYKNASVILDDDEIYPKHAILSQESGNVIITPVSRKTEVYVNARPIHDSYILRENDIINIGLFSLIVQPAKPSRHISPVHKLKPPVSESALRTAEPESEEIPITYSKAEQLLSSKSKSPEPYKHPAEASIEPLKAPDVTVETEKIVEYQPLTLTEKDKDKISGFSIFGRRILSRTIIILSTLIVTVVIILFFVGKSRWFGPGDSSGDISKIRILVEKGDYETAEKMLTNIPGKEGQELLKTVKMNIRVERAIENSQKALQSDSLAALDESINELSGVINELRVTGIDPLGQKKLRNLMTELEKKKTK